jgi:hypothetical protein
MYIDTANYSSWAKYFYPEKCYPEDNFNTWTSFYQIELKSKEKLKKQPPGIWQKTKENESNF